MATQSTLFPTLLLPVKIETRFVRNDAKGQLQLWLRIFPDAIFLDSFRRNLTPEEKADHDRFQAAVLAGEEVPEDKEGSQREIWRELVDKYGVYRAKWIIRPREYEVIPTAEESYTFGWLPTNFRIFLHFANGEIKPIDTSILPDRLPAFGDLDGITDEWISAFSTPDDRLDAVKAGMGAIIDLISLSELDEQSAPHIAKIVVVGIHDAGDDDSTSSFRELLERHEHTYGFEILDYGTPTNNTATVASGYNSEEEYEGVDSFGYAVQPADSNSEAVFDDLIPPVRYEIGSAQAAFAAAFTQLQDRAAGYGGKYNNHAATLSHALGLAATDFTHTKNASAGEPLLVDLIQRAVWFALGGQVLDLLLGDQIDPDDHCWLWEHYSTYVKPAGALPAIRVGDQPYGILPTEKLDWDDRSVQGPEDERERTLRNLLFKLQAGWTAAVEATPTGSLQPTHLPRKGREALSNTDLYRIMTMLPMSEVYQIGLYGLPKIAHKVGQFQQGQEQLPVDLSGLTISQAYQLFGKGNTFKKERAALDAFIEQIRELGQQDVKNSPQSIFSEALLKRLSDSSLTAFEPLRPYPVREEMGPGEILNPNDGKLAVDLIPVGDDWFYGAFLDFTCQINGIDTPGSSTAEGIYPIFTETPSVLTDWLDRSYRNARRLYQRTVKLSFGTEDLRRMQGYGQLIVHRIEVNDGTDVAKGTTVVTLRAQGETAAGDDPLFPIAAPFAGHITLADTIEEGTLLFTLGTPLFAIENAEKQAAHRERLDSLYAAIVMACANITDPEERNQQLRRAVNNAYDVNSFRLDAWISSLANRQLAEMRRREPAGLYYGAYGYVEDLQFSLDSYLPDTSTTTDRNHARGGIIHAPSSAQAVTAAIMKNAFDHQLVLNEPENPFTLKLTSERIQQGLQILEGMRNELEIEALLGYRLERYLHEHPGEEDLHVAIYQLRRLFPLEVNLLELGDVEVPHSRLAVINGLALLNVLTEEPDVKKRKKAFSKELNRLGGPEEKIASRIAEIIFDYLLRLEDALDGTLDVLFYEAGYQITNGNMSRAAAAMDAYKGSGDPPEIQSLTTRLAGKTVTHRLALVLPEAAQPDVDCGRAFAEPRLEAWLAQQLGPLTDIGATIEWRETAEGPATTLSITLAETGLTYSDLFYGCNEPVRDGQGTLEARIRHSVRSQVPANSMGITILAEEAPVGQRSLSDVLEVCRYAYRMITKSTGLRSEDLQATAEAASYPWEALRTIYRSQILPLVARLVPDAADRTALGPAAALPSWVDRLEDPEAMQCCAQFAFAEAQKTWLPDTPVDVATLRAEIAETVTEVLAELAEFTAQLPNYEAANDYSAAAGHLTKVAKKLFGADFQLFLPARLSPLVADTLSRPADQALLVGTAEPTGTQLWGQERIREWLQGVAQVNPNARAWEDWELVSEAWSAPFPDRYWVVQETTGLNYPWVGLSEKEIRQLLATYPDRLEPLPDGAVYPLATDSLVLHAAEGREWSTGQAVFGVLLDAFEEQIPDRTTSTGITFEYDAPNTEAPQSLLLVTPWPGIRAESTVEQGKSWEHDNLAAAVLQTMKLAKLRLVDLETLDQHGSILPFAQWLNTPKT